MYFSHTLDEPDHGSSNCGYIRSSYQWADYDCTAHQLPYICEKHCEYLLSGVDFQHTHQISNWLGRSKIP